MSKKRASLVELTGDELRACVDFCGLGVADRRVNAQLVDALAWSRQARIGEMNRTRFLEAPFLGRMGSMGRPNRYSPEVRERAVRLVLEHAAAEAAMNRYLAELGYDAP